MVSSCPNLQELILCDTSLMTSGGAVVCEGSDASPLLQLPESCTSLSIGGAAFSDAAAAVVA